MQPLVFASRFLTGDREVDAQHRALFSMANELLFAGDVRADAGLFVRGLSFLARYCEWHFASEEQAMAREGYPGLDRHRRHHRTLTAQIARLQQETALAGPTDELRDEMHLVLTHWLAFHIRILDQEFVQHVRGRFGTGSVLRPAGDAAGGGTGDDLDGVTDGIAADAPAEDWIARIRRFWNPAGR